MKYVRNIYEADKEYLKRIGYDDRVTAGHSAFIYYWYDIEEEKVERKVLFSINRYAEYISGIGDDNVNRIGKKILCGVFTANASVVDRIDEKWYIFNDIYSFDEVAWKILGLRAIFDYGNIVYKYGGSVYDNNNSKVKRRGIVIRLGMCEKLEVLDSMVLEICKLIYGDDKDYLLRYKVKH